MHVLSRYSGRPNRSVRTHLLMLWRVDMPLKPSANSDTRRDATNLNTRRTRTPGPTAINLNRAKYPPPPILSYHMPVIPFYIHLLHTQPDLLEKSQGTAEIKFRECLKKRGQSFAGLWARDHDIIIIMIFGIFSSLDTDFDTHDLWDEMNEN